ncbi:hypothetical protein [Phosphitispora sp. TUW77]|uniref:hypothetical protein n=1 Tax=Phosphitispora sp. TUW77 TaxID=3152361 RepID=UPI003AB2F983
MQLSQKIRKQPVIIWLSLISCLILILLQIFRWTLVDLVTIIIELYIEIQIYLFFVVVLFLSIRYLVKNLKTTGIKAAYPLVFQLLTVLVVIVVPWTSIIIKVDFWMNIKYREEVVKMIEAGELQPNVDYNNRLIKLPPNHASLSKGGGEILVEKQGHVTKVFFFTFRGILDNFSGFIYRSDGESPSNDDFQGDYKQIMKFTDHWYFVASS